MRAKLLGRIWVPAVCVLATAGLSSCVSRAKYDEQAQQAKIYQRSYYDLGQELANLEAENKRLHEEKELYSTGASEAGFDTGTADIDARIRELEDMLAGMGGAASDVRVFEVEGGFGVRLQEAVLFDSGSDKVRPEGREILSRVGQDIASRAYQRVWVRGHTDSVPISKPATRERFPRGNLELAAARAVEVATILVEQGKVDRSKVAVVGLGPNEPIAPNTDEQGRQLNRRVEIYVLEQDGAKY